MSNPKRSKIIAGNWKMHKNRAESKQLAEALVQAVKGDQKDLPEVVLCPPYTSLESVVSATKGSPVAVGAQNMEHRDKGAFTGEIAPGMLLDLGVQYVIIGHSERRQYYNETNASVNLKLKAALQNNLRPIVCVGESLDERESNLTDSVVARQVAAALADVASSDIKKTVFAYEPVWAIGTGKTCEAQEANRVCALIRATINEFDSGEEEGSVGDVVPILYGGSVKASNIDEQLAKSDIDGSLVGGASLTAEEFLPLIKAAQNSIKARVTV